MNELKQQVLKGLTEISKSYMTEIRKAYEEERCATSDECNLKSQEIIANLMVKFDEAEVRIKQKNKGFFK